MRFRTFSFILLFVAGLAMTSLVFAQVSKSTINELGIPEFLYYLKIPPKLEIVGAPSPPPQTEYRYREEITYGECPPPEPCPDCEPIPEEPYCDLDAALNKQGNAYKLSWACFGYDQCTITKNDQFFMSVVGDGFLENLPVGSAARIVLKLVSDDRTCFDEIPLMPPPPPPPPPPPAACSVIKERTFVSKHTTFLDGVLVSGFMPRLKFTANQGGSVNVGVATELFAGGTCLTPKYRFTLNDFSIQLGRIDGSGRGETVKFPSFNVIGSSIHELKTDLLPNCLMGAVADFGTVETKITGPLGPFCPIIETVTVPELKFVNNRLVSGSFPTLSFTAQNNERVTVDVSIDGYTGAGCLTPPYFARPSDNGLAISAIERAKGYGSAGWSWRFPEFTVPTGSSHMIKLAFAPNCLEPPIGSVMNMRNIIMTVTREYP